MTNTNLVPVFTGTISNQSIQLCNARDLHAALEVETRFNDWLSRRISEYGFIDKEDYYSILSKTSKGTKGGRPTTEYHLTLDMAKELAMVENNEKGRQIRRYFISLERKPVPDHSAQIAEIEKIFQQQYRKLKKQYNYPRALLEQSYFASEKNPACLSVSMLTNTKKFISPLFGLLNELRVDGHDVSGPLAEAEALREALITVDDALNQIWKTALEAQHVSSSQAYGSEE